MFDPYEIRKDFPILERIINGRKLIYFDNAATTHKPLPVIDAIVEFYTSYNSNIHRGLHTLSQEASEKYEKAHETVAKFIGAKNPDSIVFVRNTTEALNLVAFGWGLKNLREGDEVVITMMEHHSNILPWVKLAELKKLRLKVVDLDYRGYLRYDLLEKAITEKTRVVAVVHMSNVLGYINDVGRIARLVHEVNGVIVVDGAQSVPHIPVNVMDLDIDFLAFSGHKMLGPTGIGVLYIGDRVFDEMDTFIVGGGAIKEVHYSEEGYSIRWHDVPWRFEAGTPNIAGAIGLEAAIKYLQKIGLQNIRNHEKQLVKYLFKRLSEEELLDVVKIVGSLDTENRGGIVSFTIKNMDPHSTAILLDEEGIAVRSGFHCAQPLHERLGFNRGSVRASFYLYNTIDEIDALVDALKKISREAV